MINIKEYVKPDTVQSAYEIGQMPNSLYVSGGLMVSQIKSERLERLIDLKSLDLDYIREEENYFKIGANTKLSSLISHPAFSNLGKGFIKESIKEIGSVQIRNMATVGGSIAFRLGWSDVITIFMTAGSQVEIYKGNFQRINLEDFISQKVKGAIVTEITVPKIDGKCVFEKFAKSNFDIATLNLGLRVSLDGKFVKEARLVVGSRPMLSQRIREVEEFMIGKEIDKVSNEASELIQKVIQTGTDIRASAEYRKALSGSLLLKALRRVAQ
ncbi:FAD binding domain-containing protein [Athalassotoga saccharophila]|uniref:FAD binding domain-containing protein n=1 Tax=Athalassotoga saccharophila TaxID=1441386 RepID=UPI00137B9227|nr:FAD binding domain-containing protein [Athalassotoga saccharophila]BBJ27414.1 aerobic-type carbon monoxide dehydrogenase, middle subunit CoxM CutM-like protein [Athalassotoga saccharophila]